MITDIGIFGVVVSREWIESSKLHPSSTQFFVGVSVKPANICSDQGNAEQIKV